MSDTYEDLIADEFGLEKDPLKKLQTRLENVPGSPYESYYDRIVENKDITEESKKHYQRSFQQWQEFMETQSDRLPILANEQHVRRWAEHLLQINKEGTVQTKLNHVKKVYEWLQAKKKTPIPTDYNPYLIAKEELNLSESDADDFPHLQLEDIKTQIHDIKHIGERAATVFQFKTGIRSSELGNIRFEDIHIANAEVLDHYSDLNMGEHPQLEDRPNAVYIPMSREKNKRERPTVIPLDDETRRVLIDWLLIRPDNGDPHVFLTQKGKPMERNSLRHVWTKHWHPEYQFEESEGVRSISPHFARHWFTTWWRTKVHIPLEYDLYLRGDKQRDLESTGRSAIHYYIHTYYEDVEDTYREKIFKLDI